jgi:hypothetical protein
MASTAGVPFSVFGLTNTQGIKMKVTLESPIGTVIYGPTEVPANGITSIDPKAANVMSARVVADYGKEHGRFEQTVTLSGKKNAVYIKTLMTSAGIGGVRVTDLAGSNP